MPHLKVNVNGKRYTISGITRGTCSKQILCALAKVDAELQTSTSLTEKLNQRKHSTDSASEDQNERPRQARKLRKKSKREEKCKTCKEAEGIAKSGKKNASRKIRSTAKRVAELTNSKGIQTSNGMLETLGKVAESEQNCLSTEQKEVQVLKTSLQTLQELNGKDVKVDAVTTENAERKCVEDQAKDTDHDTGISELHSDSSFDTNQVLHNKEKVATTECSALSCSNRESQITVKCASTNTDPIEPADNTDVRMRKKSSVDVIVAELLGSETDAENDEECTCNCVYVDSDSEELREEIKKMRDELKFTEAKLAEQNQKVESLNVLMHADQRNAKQRFDDVMLHNDVSNYVSDDVTKHVDELKQSIKLSNELYDYQKIETQANALELERVESQIRRKRWHMESLLKQLRSVRNNLPTRGGPGRTVHYRNEGTLV